MTAFRPDILQGLEILLANSSNEFDENGKLTGEVYIKNLTALMDALKARI